MASDREQNLDDMTVAELRDRASELEITGRSSMNKDELRQAVADAEEQIAHLGSNGASSGEAGAASDSDSAGEDRPWREDSSPSDENDASNITAPSIGPNTTISHVPPEDRLDFEKISSVDAMGLDKRRQVGGKRYGASPAKQAAIYGGFLLVMGALLFGGKLLADELDQPPEVQEATAPWAGEDDSTVPRIDFPRQGRSSE
jgi:hypothetical protein